MALTRTKLNIIALLLIFQAIASCTSVPFDAPRSVTHASDAPKSGEIYRAAKEVERRKGGLNAVAPLADGNDALGVRLRMIETAEHTLDLQYFLIKSDSAGEVITEKLMEAANRGVRVRFLLDDAFTTTTDKELAQINAHPNIELRIFNPLSRNTAGFMNYVLAFNRVNRRMHNKSLVVDNAMAIIGGRNIADEYFQIGTDTIFADFEMLVIGPAVQDVSATFDLFWNDEYSVPIHALYRKGPVVAQALPTKAGDVPSEEVYETAINSNFLKKLTSDRFPLQTAAVTVITDHPDKVRTPVKQADKVVGEALYQAMARAKKDVVLLTPYFVPENYGARFFENLAQSGVRVRIVTNSLAANNHAYVHGGYYRHRKSLLAAGVELYEVRADAPDILGLVEPGSSSTLTMHTKAAEIDQSLLFVGSLNLDPRSIKINSELALFFDSKDRGLTWFDNMDEGLEKYTFRLVLDGDGKVVWIYNGTGQNEQFRSEPGASGWAKFVAWMARVLPVESQL